VVSDTTAVTTLIKARREHLLQNLFGNVMVPRAVWDELRAFHLQLPDFVSLRPVTAMVEIQSLGRGEAEAIQLAREVQADLLLSDDLKARAVATRLKIKCAGLLGVMVRAKQTGYIASVREVIEALEAQGGLYLSETVKAEALKLAGESQ
ncbi:MAG TPA: DUF3368 domain-containing protein, partial [Candidatus Acidoferrales bacterium]|nr:DUF3368 domain-containing protein [Candidatus Acidoferrales bacterium]